MKMEWSFILIILMATMLMMISLTHLVFAILTGRRKEILIAAVEEVIDFVIFHGVYDSFGYGEIVSVTGRFLSRLKHGSLAVFLLFSVLLILSVLRLLNMQHTIKTSITPFSTGEALDRIPTGVMLYLEDGEVVQSNSTMEELFREWTGRPLFDANALWDGSVPEELIVQHREPMILRSSDGGRWQLSVRETDMDYGKPVYELLATNVTREDRLLHQLNREIGELKRVNARLKEYNFAVDDVVRKEELLEAKRRVHGNMGADLLAARVLLLGEESPVDARDVLDQWRRNVHLMHEEAREKKKDDSGDRLRAAAAFLGIDLQISGEMPADTTAAELITIAVGECLTNAMQHAQADRVDVEIREDETEITARISNNGTPPKHPIREGGGLSMLRHSVEKAGASMDYPPGSIFVLELHIPKGHAGGEI